jgi:hypothetical protein
LKGGGRKMVRKIVLLKLKVSMAGKDIVEFITILTAHKGRLSEEPYDISTPGRINFSVLIPEPRLGNFKDMIATLPGKYQFSTSVAKV